MGRVGIVSVSVNSVLFCRFVLFNLGVGVESVMVFFWRLGLYRWVSSVAGVV